MKVNCDGSIEGWSFPKIDAEEWETLQHNDQGDGRRENGPTSPPTSSPFHPPSC
jgi:hypothetical protein